MTTRSALGALGSGLLFGAGLLVSGMTDPARVRAFLDFTGNWNPSLAGVMGAAIAVHATALWLERRRLGAPPARQAPIEARVLAGAAVFGVGWGLGGFCPGPAIVSLAFVPFGVAPAAIGTFFAALVVGVLVADATVPARVRAETPNDAAGAAEAPSC